MQIDLYPTSAEHRIITDIPPPLPKVESAICRTPDELLAFRHKFKMPTYALHIYTDKKGRAKNSWLFSSDLQDMVAAGLRWHARGFSLEQFAEDEDGETGYGYRIKNFPQATDLLYESWLWNEIHADMNEVATPWILTQLRHALFKHLSENSLGQFCLLDFSRPNGEAQYLEDWANELDL